MPARSRISATTFILSAALLFATAGQAQQVSIQPRPATQPTSAPATRPAGVTTSAPTTATSQPDGPPTTVPADHPQRSPWATMKVFLIRVGESENDPSRINDAVLCLDLAKMDPATADEQGPRLAKMLAEIIGHYGITLDRIPDEWHGPPYVYLSTDDGEVTLDRRPDGLWRFTPETTESIPDLYREVRRAATTQRAQSDNQAPAERRSARATLGGFSSALDRKNVAKSLEFLDLGHVPEGIRSEYGGKRATKLGILLGRVRDFVLEEVPDEPNGLPYVLYTGARGRIEIARQESGERRGEWLFTTGSVDAIDELYREFEDKQDRVGESRTIDLWTSPSIWLRERIPPSLKQHLLGVERWHWIGLILVLLVGATIGRLTAAILRVLTAWWVKRRRADMSVELQSDSLRPLGVLAMVGAWYAGLSLLDLGAKVELYLWPATQFILTLVCVWAAYALVDLVFGFFIGGPTRSLRVNKLLVPLLSKSAKVIVAAFGAIFVLRALGVPEKDVNTLIGALGLGGLAFTLAAQDTLRNFFGSFVVVLDPPFRIGDWIKVGEVEGEVESVGLRSLRIRTTHDSQVTIPNSNLISTAVDNFGARRFGRIKCELAIDPTTRPAQVEAFCEGIRELLRRHAETNKERIHVWVSALKTTSIEIVVSARLVTTDRGVEIGERHRVFLDIVRLADRLGISLTSSGAATGGERDGEDQDDPQSALERGRQAALAIRRER